MTDPVVDGMADPPERRDARGPSPRDLVMALTTTAWVFLLLGLARLIWFVREWDMPPSANGALTFAATVVPAVGAVVLPAALALRHPDAPVRAPWLFLGTVMLAAVEGLRVLSRPLQPFLEQVAPAAPETPFLVPLAILYSAVAGLLGAAAIGAIARGLTLSRRYADRASNRPFFVLIGSFVVLIAVGRLIALGQLRWDQVPLTPVVIIYVASTAVLGILSIAAWGYLTATAIAGARAGEEPEWGWLLGSVGASMVLGAFAANAVVSLMTATAESTTFWQTIALVISLGFALGYLGTVAAFLVGVPSLEPVPDDALEEPPGNGDDADAALDARTGDRTVDFGST